MKLFWKVFFTTMFVSAVCVTLSGYLLINSNFRSQLDNEIKMVQDYGEIVYHSLASAFEDPTEHTDLLSVAKSIRIEGLNQRIAFGILDARGETLFSTLAITLDKEILSSLNGIEAGWALKKEAGGVYVQTVRPVSYRKQVFYIEMVRDVTHIFTVQRSQHKMMIKILAAMILLAGIVTFFVLKRLLGRITALTETTKTISDGRLEERAKVDGTDEIGILSKNFNQMADHLEEKIHELESEAERKELFVGAFSHELKTPLTSIIGYADLLRHRELGAEQRRVCADYIFFEGKRLETLSMRLLDLIVLKKHSLSPKPAEIKGVLDEVRALLTPQLKQAGIELVYEVEPAVILMEVELMKTVFINLIDNARKAIEGTGMIIVHGEQQDGRYTVSVQDSGKGMKSQELPRIMDAFYRVNKSRAQEQGGAGLGLAICNEIIMLHGFKISFDSAVGVGTIVTVAMEAGRI